MPRSTRKRLATRKRLTNLGTVLAIAPLAAGLSSCSTSARPAPSASPTVSAYLAAWASRDWSAMARLVYKPPPDFQAQNLSALKSLGSKAEHYSAGALVMHKRRATVPVTERLQLAEFGSFTVRTTLDLRLVRRHWHVVWTPATINPAFGTNGHYAVSYTWPQRAAILAADGTAISPGSPTTVVIGLEGKFVKNVSSLVAALVNAGATSSEASNAVAAAQANPTGFEPVFTVPWARYQQLRPSLYPVPGVFFQSQGGSGSTPPALAGVVGTLGAITKAQLKQLGPPYDASSTVGQGGLEQANERQLAGRPEAKITAVSPGKAPRVLASFPGQPGKPVTTTIDPTIEQDAVTALSSAPGEAALVAIQASTGKVVAVANTSQGSDLALEGQLPPGSTMKIITSTALIGKGLTPASPATCPPVINVDGENIHNAGSETASNMLQAFTVSCNTAYIGLTMANLNNASLHQAAMLYRIGSTLNIGLPAFGGSVPVTVGPTDLAASAIGQSRVVMSPLDLAMVAADIDTSTVRTPYLAVGAPAQHQPTAPLPGPLVADLHEMMLSVVLNGTASGTGLPPGTYAKTGTAQYGTTNPLPIDGWLAGFNGNIAFAMVTVNSPSDGGPTDGPIVARFLSSLGSTG